MPVRPKSIVQFEQVYWAAVLLGLVNVALGWSDMMAQVQVQQSVARLGPAVVYLPLVIGLLIQVALWYFIARRASVVAKWIFAVLVGVGTAWNAISLATGGAASPLVGIVGVVLVVLQVVAIVLLFRPDTRQWFGEDAVAA